LEVIVGPKVAEVLQKLTRQTHESSGGSWTAAASVLLLLISGTGAALGLKDALNTIWGVVENPNRGWLGMIGDRLLALLLVSGFGALLLASTTLTAVLVGMGDYLMRDAPFPVPVARLANTAVSGATVMLFLAAAFRWLPAARIRWREIWMGAAVTAFLFLVGKELIGLYLGRVAVGSVYGTAGSLVLVMLWVYYSAQILLLGAEFTQVYASRNGVPIEPEDGASLAAKRRERMALASVSQSQPASSAKKGNGASTRAERRRESPSAKKGPWGWSKLVWAAGGLVLGWLIGVLNG
jgi:membrane protein